MADNFGKESTPTYGSSDEPKTAGQPLSDFLLQLEDYTPTVINSFIIINGLLFT